MKHLTNYYEKIEGERESKTQKNNIVTLRSNKDVNKIKEKQALVFFCVYV